MLDEILRIVFDSGFEVSERIPHYIHNRFSVYPMTGTAISPDRLFSVFCTYILCHLLTIARPVTIHKTSAIMAYHLPIKRMRCAPSIGIAFNARPALLSIVKGLLVDNRLLRILKYLPILLSYIVALLVLKMLSCLKVYRMPKILFLGKNVGNR